MRRSIRVLLVALSVTVTCAFALPAAPTGGTPPLKQHGGPTLDWRGISLQPGPQDELIGCRSPIVEHQVRHPVEEPFEFAGNTFTFDAHRRYIDYTLELAEPGEEEEPLREGRLREAELVTFNRDGQPYALTLWPAGDLTAVYIASAYGAPILVPGGRAYLVDSDRDGHIGSDGDGLVVPGAKTVAVWTGQIWTRQGAVAVREQNGQWEQAAIPMPHPGNADHAEAWRITQWWRQMTGVAPIQYDESLEADLVAHARYLMRNNTFGHAEDPRLPGYSEAGNTAGCDSVLGRGHETYVEGILGQLYTMFHRNQVLEPGVQRSALVLEGEIFGMRIRAAYGGPLADATVVFPPHGMEDVPPAFQRFGERPMPVPREPAGNGLGTSITVHGDRIVDGMGEDPILEVRAGRGEVRGYLHWPGNLPRGFDYEHYFNTVGLTPSRELRSNYEHFARTSVPLRGGEVFQYEWSFTTGSED